ncbi:MAG: cyclic 2,3-diphosphoglycerate synthase [Pseudomonadales bacterium]
MTGTVKRLVICGAAGRDFHDFNVVYRGDPAVRVVAFTAAQIPGIAERRYPPELAGSLYPDGIPIVEEAGLAALCEAETIDEVVFAYSDVTNDHVMRIGSTALAAGADFTLLGPRSTMLETSRPAIAVCAVRTGCGKSQTSRYIASELTRQGYRVATLRHPMPYGEPAKQAVQRFATLADIDAANCSLEEREEYEPHVEAGGTVFAGVDYARILEQAQAEADVVLWDGGNNDFSFIRAGLNLAIVDALRPARLDGHYPGSVVLETADLVVVNKVDAATPEQLRIVNDELDRLVPGTPRVMAASPVTLDDPAALAGARVLIVEDGPTITHGDMPYGAGYQAVRAVADAEIVDPRPFATPEIAAVFEKYPHIGPVLPAMGYGSAQVAALVRTINAADVDVVVAGTPIDLARVGDLRMPVVRAHYRYVDAGEPGLMHFVDEFLSRSAV